MINGDYDRAGGKRRNPGAGADECQVKKGAKPIGHDFRPLMPKVKNPVLWMCGEKDGHNAAIMRQMQKEFPAAKYVELPGAGHISNMDQPALFTKTLREFLAA